MIDQQQGKNELDVDYVRSQFPSLINHFVLLDNAGGSAPLNRVINATQEYLEKYPVQLGASYQVSLDAAQRVQNARTALATWLNAPQSQDIVLGGSYSNLLLLLAESLRPQFKPGDEIIVTNTDHEANISPWHRLISSGIKIKTWPLNTDSWQLEWNDLAPLLTEKTRLVCFTHCSNITGTVEPAKELIRKIHAVGAQACVDGVAFAPHDRVNLSDLNADYYGFSLYKVFGPHLGLLYVNRKHHHQLLNLNHRVINAGSMPTILEPGGANYELSYAAGTIPGYFSDLAQYHNKSVIDAEQQLSLAYQLMRQHEDKLFSQLLDFLQGKKHIKLIGKASVNGRNPTLAFISSKLQSKGIVEQVDSRKIGIRFGSFYANALIKALGLSKDDGVVRVSIAHYNDENDIERLCQALDKILP